MKKHCIYFSLLILSGCGRKPYEQFKKERTVYTSYETSGVIKTLKKKNLTKRVKDMTAAEAFEAKSYYESIGRTDMVLVLMPHIIAVSQDVGQIANTTLEYADLELSLGKFDEALKLYTKFVTSYPGHAKIKTGRYRQMLTAFWNLPDYDCDQSGTKVVVEYATSYLRDFPQDPEYRKQVHAILRASYQKLLANELYTFWFYLNKFYQQSTEASLQAAFLRLQYIQSKMLSGLERYEPELKQVNETLGQELVQYEEKLKDESSQKMSKQEQAKFLQIWYDKLLYYTNDHNLAQGGHAYARDIF